MHRSAGPDALRIHARRSTIPRPSVEADAPVRPGSSDKRVSFLANNVRKRCIRTSKCKLRHSLISRPHTARILFAFPLPCCQSSGRVYGLTQLPAQPRCTKRIQLSCRRREPKFSTLPPISKTGQRFCHIIVISSISSAERIVML